MTCDLNLHCFLLNCYYYIVWGVQNHFYFPLSIFADVLFVLMGFVVNYWLSFMYSFVTNFSLHFATVLLPTWLATLWFTSATHLAGHEFRFVYLPSHRMIHSCPWNLFQLPHLNLTLGMELWEDIWWLQRCVWVTTSLHPNLVSVYLRKFLLKAAQRLDEIFLSGRSL